MGQTVPPCGQTQVEAETAQERSHVSNSPCNHGREQLNNKWPCTHRLQGTVHFPPAPARPEVSGTPGGMLWPEVRMWPACQDGQEQIPKAWSQVGWRERLLFLGATHQGLMAGPRRSGVLSAPRGNPSHTLSLQ